MNLKITPILHWFSSVKSFSVEKIFMYFVVKCFDDEIKDCPVFNFIRIYKRKGVSY